VSCAKTAEPIEISFGMWTRSVQGTGGGVRIDATRQIRLNRSCAAAMRLLSNYFNQFLLLVISECL